MARNWALIHQASHHLLHSSAGDFPAISFFAIAGGLIISLCCVTLILGMCTLYKRRQVGDKASSSDGDGSPTSTAAASSRQGFFLTTLRKNSSTSAQRLMQKHASEEEEQSKEVNQQQGKLSPHVWQRGILMGERCQRPTFSGLVLYDERGNPLPRRLPA